jgi:predicted transcriptional regulator
MKTTLTIRLPKKQRAALKRRAAAQKRSESAIVRELIEREMQRGFDFERVRHVVGSSPARINTGRKTRGEDRSANATGAHEHVSFGYWGLMNLWAYILAGIVLIVLLLGSLPKRQ